MPSGEDTTKKIKGLNGYCSPLLTAGDVLFHSGTRDQQLYAYDADNGNILGKLIYPQDCTGPITYKLKPEGKKYFVIASGSHDTLGSKIGILYQCSSIVLLNKKLFRFKQSCRRI